MKRLVKAIAVLAVVLIAGCGLIFIMLGGPQELARRRHFDALVKAADHQALLAAAIQVIQGTTNDVTYYREEGREPSITSLPAIIHKMDPKYVAVDPDGMRIECHGGFDHYGFDVRREDRWELSWYTEHGHQSLASASIEGKANHHVEATR